MKAAIYGWANNDQVLLGEIRLHGQKLTYAIAPDAPPTARDVLKKIVTNDAPRFGDESDRFIQALPFLYDSPYLRARFVGDKIEKEFDESKHPRAEDGKFGQGGGRAIVNPAGIGADLGTARTAEHVPDALPDWAGPAPVYHVTRGDLADKIKTEGLKRGGKWRNRAPSVYYTTTLRSAETYASKLPTVMGYGGIGTPVHYAVVEFKRPTTKEITDTYDKQMGWDSYRVTRDIPASEIIAIHHYERTEGEPNSEYKHTVVQVSAAKAEDHAFAVVFLEDEVAKAFDENEHPRDERGRFAIGGGQGAGNGHPLYGGNEMSRQDKEAAAEYDAAPEVGPGAKEAWAKLADDTNKKYDEIAKKVKIEKVTGQPYKSAEEMNADIAKGTFKVTTDNSEHPLWNEEQNWKFRVVHDYVGHFKNGNDFSMQGERKAFLDHAKGIEDADARKAAQVEIHSQAAAFTAHKEFQKQKVYLPKTDLSREMPGEPGLTRTNWKSTPTAEEFIAERDKNPRADFMSHLNPEDLKGSKIILSEDGKAGATVAPDGDIQNVFRNPGAPRGSGTAAALEGVKRGGLMLDCYDYERKGRPGLPDVYRRAGFVETGRMKFNATYRPEWANEGRSPDVVFMAYVGGDQSASPKSDRYYGSTEWDQAKAHSKLVAKPLKLTIDDELRAENERRRTRAQKPLIGGNLGRALDQAARWAMAHPKKAETIEEDNKKIEENRPRWSHITHLFRPAEFTAGNGHPRCVRCGDEEPEDGMCMPGIKKWETMLTAWTEKFETEWGARIEVGESSMSNWVSQFHSKCIEKGEVCKIAWPLCPVGKSDTVAKYITGHNGTFQVHAESGKVLGTHDTKADAEAQLRAIEAHKHGTGKDVQWPVTPSIPNYGKRPLIGEKAPNQKSEEIAPDDVTIEALKSAWQAFAKSIGLVFKSEEVLAEPIETNVYRIEAAGRHAYFQAESGKAERIEYYRKDAFVTVQKSEKQRYTLGAVYAPGETDFHGDTMTEVELEKAAWAFAKKDGLTKRVGLQHQSGTDGAGEIVESYIYRGPKWTFKDTAGNEQTIMPGTWMLGTVWTPESWAKIERRAVTGYSLQGVARKFANGEEV